MARTLRVVANPYASLDHEGNPAGAFPVEGAPTVYVGAVPKHDVKPRGAAFLGRNITTIWEFSSEEVEVPDTPYYRGGLRDGAILPADEYTASKVGLQFATPSAALGKRKAEAAKRFHDMNGETAPFMAHAPKSIAPKASEGDR